MMIFNNEPYKFSQIIKFLLIGLVFSACQPVSPEALQVQDRENITATKSVATQVVNSTSTLTIQPTQTIAATPKTILKSGEDAADFISESIPDGSYITPGEPFTKTWTLENSGSNTWTTDYHLVIFASPQGDILSSPTTINFPEMVQPGDKTEIKVSLIAPQTAGNYAVYWQLQNAQDEPFYVDGGNLWTQIKVAKEGEQPPQTYTQAITISQQNGITIELINIEIGTTESYADFCVYFPAGEEKMVGGGSAISLLFNNQVVRSIRGNTVDINDPATMSGPHRCYHFEFPGEQEELQSGTIVQLSINCLRKVGTPPEVEASCAKASIDLPVQYPGLSFTCLPFSAGNFYTGLQVPASMTEAEADQIIRDAIEEAVYGPWILAKEINP